MKIILCFFFLLAGSYCQNVNSPVINSDEDKHIERPCEMFDIFCIRKYFAKHSNCKMQNQQVPDPLYRAHSTGNFPRLNLTLVAENVRYTGLNGRIDEFYINKKTDKIILAVEFRVMMSSNTTYFVFHRRAKESIVTLSSFTTTFNTVVVTIIIPNLKDLQLQRGEVFGYGNEAIPELTVGPNSFNNPDPAVLVTGSQFLLQIPVNAREYLLTEGTFLIGTYIQYSICDFGLDIM